MKRAEPTSPPPEPAVESPVSIDEMRPRRRLKPEEFWKVLAAYPKDAATMIYVYRCWPRIVKEPKYVEKLTELSEAQLLRLRGSGTYEIRLTDANKRPTEVCRTICKLDDSDFAPVIDPGTLDLGHPENASYVAGLRARGLLQQEETEMAEQTAAATAVEKMADMASAVIRDAKAKPADQSPVQVIGEVAKALKDLMPAPAPGNDALISKLLEQNTALLVRLADRAAPPAAADPLETYSKIDEVVSRAAARQSGNGPSWIELLAPAIPAVTAFLTGLVARLQVPPTNSSAPVSAPPPQIPAAATAVSEMQSDGGMVQMLSMLGIPPQMAGRLIEVGKNALSAYQRGVPGDDFAQSLCTFSADGEDIYSALLAMGKESILQLAGTLGGAAVSDKAALAEWLDAFIAYNEPEPEPGKPEDE